MDRNFEAIAIVAWDGSLIPGFSQWKDIDEADQGIIMEAVLAIARGEDVGDTMFPPQFPQIVRACLEMYEGHGRLAIEDSAKLARFMLIEMKIEPGEPGVDQRSIADVAIETLNDLREQVFTLQEQAKQSRVSDQLAISVRGASLAAAARSTGYHTPEDLIERAAQFERYVLTGATPAQAYSEHIAEKHPAPAEMLGY